MKKKYWKEQLWNWFQAGLIAIALTLVLRNFILIPIAVEGSSMLPTLHQHDEMIMAPAFQIKRFDLLVFKDEMNRTLVKRVIGLPNETIYYQNDHLFVNGKKVPETFLNNKWIKKSGDTWTSDFNLTQIIGKEKIPPDEYFVLGDNRRASNDSRVFGTIHRQKIIGRVIFVYYPLKHLAFY